MGMTLPKLCCSADGQGGVDVFKFPPKSSETLCTGHVHRWKKRWIHVPPNSSHTTATNGGNNRSNLLLLKSTPVASNQAKDGSHCDDDSESDKDDVIAALETPRKIF
ncbi:Unknown protein, partial [Striga hermonthica]